MDIVAMFDEGRLSFPGRGGGCIFLFGVHSLDDEV